MWNLVKDDHDTQGNGDEPRNPKRPRLCCSDAASSSSTLSPDWAAHQQQNHPASRPHHPHQQQGGADTWCVERADCQPGRSGSAFFGIDLRSPDPAGYLSRHPGIPHENKDLVHNHLLMNDAVMMANRIQHLEALRPRGMNLDAEDENTPNLESATEEEEEEEKPIPPPPHRGPGGAARRRRTRGRGGGGRFLRGRRGGGGDAPSGQSAAVFHGRRPANHNKQGRCITAQPFRAFADRTPCSACCLGCAPPHPSLRPLIPSGRKTGFVAVTAGHQTNTIHHSAPPNTGKAPPSTRLGSQVGSRVDRGMLTVAPAPPECQHPRQHSHAPSSFEAPQRGRH